ncbi:hypothetical protein GCM10009719_13010 [Nocardioides kribbensis]
MAHEVKVRQPLAALDLDIAERALGERPLDRRKRDHVPAHRPVTIARRFRLVRCGEAPKRGDLRERGRTRLPR